MFARVVVGCLAIGLVGLQSCTAVLGMERATLDLTSDGSAPAVSTSPCNDPPTDDCNLCIEQHCGAAFAACLDSFSCRATLDSYALCVGESCAKAPATCASKLDGSVRGCLGSCAGECTGTSLATECDLYCGCLGSCVGVGTTIAPTGQECFTKCEADSATPGLVSCQRGHCERGKGRENHCLHATGQDPQCLNAIQSGLPKQQNCFGLSERGWFCDVDSECCSGDCIGTGACK